MESKQTQESPKIQGGDSKYIDEKKAQKIECSSTVLLKLEGEST